MFLDHICELEDGVHECSVCLELSWNDTLRIDLYEV